MSEEVKQYDCIVIGAGQAGVPLAKAFANEGRQTALIERLHVGGTCINEGCTPTKTMIASGETAYLARRGGDYGVITGHVRIDQTRVRQRKRDIVESFMTSSVESIKATPNLELVFGHAHFTGPGEIEALTQDGTFLGMSAPTIIVNTGGRPHMPPIRGLDTIPAYDSTTIMEIDQVPEHLIVLGGGYIAVEFAQLFRRFGSRVTIVQRGSQLLNREDRDVAKVVVDLLREDGIRVLLGSEAVGLEKGAESIRVTINSQGMEVPIEGTHVLVALGRTPNTDGLDLPAAGIETDEHGYIRVNEDLSTSAPGVYAAGDVTGAPAFTHLSYDDFRSLRANLLRGEKSTRAGRMEPYTVFMDPQLGRIGIGEDEARRQGLNIQVARLEMSHVARALETDRPRGFMKAVVDAQTSRILGFCCLGLDGGEIMAMVEIAMMADLPYQKLRDGIFAHPTLAESLNNLFSAVD